MNRSVVVASLGMLALASCGYSEQEWQAQMSRYERIQNDNQNLQSQLIEAQKELETTRAQAAAAGRAQLEAPPPAATATAAPAPTAIAAPPVPTATDRDDGIRLNKLRGRITVGAKPEAVVDVEVKALGADAKVTVEQVEGPCTLELEKFRVRAAATEAGTCKGRVTALNAAGTQRTIKEFSLEASTKKAEPKKDDTKKAEPKKDDTKKAEPKK
jgi:hypothetical protein